MVTEMHSARAIISSINMSFGCQYQSTNISYCLTWALRSCGNHSSWLIFLSSYPKRQYIWNPVNLLFFPFCFLSVYPSTYIPTYLSSIYLSPCIIWIIKDSKTTIWHADVYGPKRVLGTGRQLHQYIPLPKLFPNGNSAGLSLGSKVQNQIRLQVSLGKGISELMWS